MATIPLKEPITGNISLQSGSTQVHSINKTTEKSLYTRREIYSTMAGVLLVMLLASLDQTIVDTAMPHIITDLQGFSLYTWVTTGYLLTSTVMVPIYGKLSDIFGRKPIFLIGVVLFLIGSAASGAAQNMVQLIAFRAFQGLGAAALMPIAMAVVGDLFTARERGRWQGVTGSIFALSSVLGPTVGGWITDHASWRWVFYVNLPVGIAAMLVLIFLMPTLHSQRPGKAIIDYLGAILLAAGTVPLLLGFTWAGSQYVWLSVQTIGLLAGAVILIAIFIIYEAYRERHNRQPIIDPSMFKNSVFSASVLITMITSMGMFGSAVFLPLFAQGVLGFSATESGLRLVPLMGGMLVSSMLAGQLVARFGRYKWIAFVGMAITIGGSLLLLRLNINSTNMDLIIAMIVLGLGLGFSMSLYTIIVQNAMPTRIGQATSGLTFFRSIGSTIAVAAMGSVLNATYVPGYHNALSASLKKLLSAQAINTFNDPNVLLSPSVQQQFQAQLAHFGTAGQTIYTELIQAVKVGLTSGIHSVFVFSTIMMCLGFVAIFFLKELPLSDGRKQQVAVELLETAPIAIPAEILPKHTQPESAPIAMPQQAAQFRTPFASNGHTVWQPATAPITPAYQPAMHVSAYPPQNPEALHRHQLTTAVNQLLTIADEADISLSGVYAEIERQKRLDEERKRQLTAAVEQLLAVAYRCNMSLAEIHREIDRQSNLLLQATEQREEARRILARGPRPAGRTFERDNAFSNHETRAS
jgi:EmrB/QacA subfamily drug resistance transporter